MTQEELAIHLAGCQKHSRISQKVLYLGYYDFALSICRRYISSNEIIKYLQRLNNTMNHGPLKLGFIES